MAFQSTSPALDRALAERNYDNPTPVQQAVLEPGTAGRDLLVSAQTGSGKTVAYGLAIAGTLLGDAEKLDRAGAPLALIVAPTRELALQVERELVWLYEHAGARIVSCVGGMDPRREQRQLEFGAHIVVGTPGRLRDHLERGRLDVSELKAVVLDEADEMLDLGFREDLEFILEATPPTRRTLLFSATLPRGIAALARNYQRDALRIEAAGGEGGHADIEYRAIRVMPKETEHVVVNVLRQSESPSAIVFCNTRESVRHLAATLQERGFSSVALSGELGQNERNRALQALRDGRARVCVATDVAARGIDLPNLGLVIHAELPNDAESLQHRSGRTGRAGRKGVSVLLVPPFRRRRAEQLMADIGAEPAWMGPPTAEDIRKLDQQRMLNDPLITEEAGEEDLALGRALLEEKSPEQLAAVLVRIYRAQLPAPEEVSDPGEGRPTRKTDFERKRTPSGSGETAWFRLGVGRRKNADPKWILPLICRRGNVTKQDVGAIRISEDETAFEITTEAAGRFTAALRNAGREDITIEPLPGGPPDTRPARKPAYRKSGQEKANFDKPNYDKPAYDRPAYDKAPRERAPYQKHERDRQADDRQTFDRPAREKPAYDKPAREKPAYDKPAYDKPAHEKRAYPKRDHDKPAQERPKYAKPDNAAKAPFRKHAADDRKAGGKPSGKPAGKPGGKPGGKPKGKFKGGN